MSLEGNTTGTAAPDTLAAIVASFGARGERSAIVAFRRDGVATLTYAQLAEAIERAARGLRAQGIAQGDRIALLGPNSPEWIVAYFAVVTTGGVAMPLDPQTTREAVAAAAARTTPRAIITTRAQREALAPLVAPEVRFWLLDGDDDLGASSAGGAHDGPATIAPEDLASLLFTSGTTGTPKAVPLTHANLAGNVGELLAAHLLTPDDRVLLPLPLHHTYPFTAGLLTTLATGATVVLPAGLSGPDILDACRVARPTALLAVPRLCTALWESVQSQVEARGPLAARAFSALLRASIALRRATGLRVGRWLFRPVHARLGGALELIGCGGAKLSSELAWNLEGLGLQVLTGYGLTETSPVLTFNSPRHTRLGSEGRPLPGVELRIGDSRDDTPGEILARGPGVFAGYWHDATATAACFNSDGWFRTGDLGRIDPDGYLYVVGRSKELIVLADGKKFFPETVEKAYAATPLVHEIGMFERGGLLAAVVVPDEDELRRRGTLSEATSLRSALEDVGAKLPSHQRISSYRVVRSALPRTQLGKLRRHLLPALFDGAVIEQAGQAPEPSDADRTLLATPVCAAAWQWLRDRYPDHVLSLDTSPQLDLMIDSLGWVALTVEIERRFKVALDSERLARILTLRDLLRELAAAPASGAQRTPEFSRPPATLRAFGAFLLLTARLLARLTMRVSVKGIERLPPGPSIIAPNHASYLDPLVVAAALPWQRLRRTYWAGWVGVMHTSPWRRLVSRAVQVFPVDPDRDLAAAVHTARELLADGYDIVWFPEGRRSPTGALQNFQPGVGWLAEGTAAAVVPVAIRGTFEAWPKHRRWPRPGRVQVAFGEPLTASDRRPPDETAAALQRSVGTLLDALCAPDRERST